MFLLLDNRPPGMVPAKAAYMGTDLKRLARFYEIPLKLPAVSAQAISPEKYAQNFFFTELC